MALSRLTHLRALPGESCIASGHVIDQLPTMVPVPIPPASELRLQEPTKSRSILVCLIRVDVPLRVLLCI
jgi:hypothetical protein